MNPKLPILMSPSAGGTSAKTAVPIQIAPEWQSIVEPITLLKDAIDIASRWPEIAKNTTWVKETLAASGLTIEGLGKLGAAALPQCPDHFLKLFLGRCIWQEERQPCGWYLLPDWSTIGWVRKYEGIAQVGRPDAKAAASQLDLDTVNGLSDNTTICVGGIPVFYAGEGKNRASLQRKGGVPRRSKFFFVPLPSMSLNVASLALCRDVLIAKSSLSDQWVVPIGKVAAPLYSALGIEISRVPSFIGWITVARTLKKKGLSFASILRVLVGQRDKLREQLLRRDE